MSTEMCKELQQQEWQALQAIYPDFVPSELPSNGEPVHLQVGVQLPESIRVLVLEESMSEVTRSVNVSHLPPLSMRVLLPETYPLEHPPVIHSLYSSHDWLPPTLIDMLIHILLGMWRNESVLGMWIEHIQNGEELLQSLNLLHGNCKSIQLLNPTPSILLSALAAHNTSVLGSHFRNSTHTCPICLNRLLGSHCILLSKCMHVVCRSCLGDFWGSCISEGDVARVTCPDPECVKQSAQASMEDVESVVSPEEVTRWQFLLRKQAIERDPTVVICPVVSCQLPVTRPSSVKDDDPSEWDRLRTCECGFAFCVYCRRGWHGPHTPCAVPRTAEFVRLYRQYPEGSAERLDLEKRHGKRNIMRILAKFDEDQQNRKWMDRETTICPGCQAPVVGAGIGRAHYQKAGGCNHITCSCGGHFCYLCAAKLDRSNPYHHFNTPGLPCYRRLFDIREQVNEDEPEHWSD